MSIGTIIAKIALDQPDLIHCGPGEPVTGNVNLTFRRAFSNNQSSSEFFGPMRVHVNLHGRVKTKIKKSNGNSSHIYRGRVPLFDRQKIIFNDSAKIAANETWPIPFALAFPNGLEYKSASIWESDSRFNVHNDQPLPPSFERSYHGFSNHFDCFVEYRVGVTIETPHVQVDIIKPQKYAEPLVHYSQPRPMPTLRPPPYHKPSNTVRVSNANLLPEEDRPSGFRQKAKAKLSSDFYPHYKFEWKLQAPQEVHRGQPLVFEMAVKPLDDQNTAVVVPEIYLTAFRVSIIGYTIVRAEKQLLSCPEAEHEETTRTLTGATDDNGPFSKRNDWRKTINTPALTNDVFTTFRTVNISHTHVMQVTLVLKVAGETMPYTLKLRVNVLPPVAEVSAGSSSAAPEAATGPSTQTMNVQSLDEALPRYEDELPSYNEALDEAAPAVPPNNAHSMAV